MEALNTKAAYSIILTLAMITPLCVAKFCVRIQNQMSPHDDLILALCQSKDTNIGPQLILPGGDDIKWCFGAKSGTLFWCTLDLKDKHLVFNVYYNDEDYLRNCTGDECFWVALENGVWLWNGPKKEFDLKYPWNT